MTEPNLRFPAVFCENLRFSAKICGFLRFPAPSKCLNFQEKGWICENLRFSAKICVLGILCHLRSVTLSSPWVLVNPVSRKSVRQYFGVQRCEIGEECRRFWAWILGVDFLGGLKPWSNAETLAEEIRWEICGQVPKIHQTKLKNSAQIPSAEPRDQEVCIGNGFRSEFKSDNAKGGAKREGKQAACSPLHPTRKSNLKICSVRGILGGGGKSLGWQSLPLQTKRLPKSFQNKFGSAISPPTLPSIIPKKQIGKVDRGIW